MPAGIVEHEQNAFASTLRRLYGHRIKEDLENRLAAMGSDQPTNWRVEGLAAPMTFCRT